MWGLSVDDEATVSMNAFKHEEVSRLVSKKGRQAGINSGELKWRGLLRSRFERCEKKPVWSHVDLHYVKRLLQNAIEWPRPPKFRSQWPDRQGGTEFAYFCSLSVSIQIQSVFQWNIYRTKLIFDANGYVLYSAH